MFRFIALALCLWPGAASAATMTFTGLPSGEVTDTWSEDGITAKSAVGAIGAFTGPGTAHMDDGGTGYTGRIDFTTGGLFEAVGFDVHALETAYCTDFDCGVPYDNVVVEGWLDGVQVAADAFFMGSPGTVSSYLFGSPFDLIDRLVIGTGFPSGAGGFCLDSPCGHFDIDNVTLNSASPVPLPPAIILFLSAMAGMLGVGFLQQRVRAGA